MGLVTVVSVIVSGFKKRI